MPIVERIAKLIDVKSLMTLALTGCFIWLAAGGKIDGQQFLGIFTMITGFYFGTQSMKNNNNSNNNNTQEKGEQE